jgi:hypothetical protein
MTVESFQPDRVSFRRVDYGSYPLNATMTGQISSNGNTLANGTMHVTSFGGKQVDVSAPIRMSWGDALNSLPGSDELDRAQAQQSRQPQIVITPTDVLNGINVLLDWAEAYQRFRAVVSQSRTQR